MKMYKLTEKLPAKGKEVLLGEKTEYGGLFAKGLISEQGYSITYAPPTTNFKPTHWCYLPKME